MRANIHEVPPVFQEGQSAIRMTEWGGLTVEAGEIGPEAASLDFDALFQGLPDNRCQCPHWGYVIQGRMRYHYADRIEVYETGDLYYVEPGHRPEMDDGTRYIEFSPSDEIRKTLAVIESNVAAMQAG